MPEVSEYIDAKAAAELMNVSPRTFRRYCRGHYGVTLRTAQIGRRPVTTQKWIAKFIKEYTEHRNANA